MDRPSPSDPSDEPVNRLAGFFGKADLLAPKPSLSSQPIEVLSAIELDWSLQAWNSLVELYRHEPEGDHREVLMAFILRNWEDDSVPMSFIRESLGDAGEPVAGFMMRDLDQTLSSGEYARMCLAGLVGGLEYVQKISSGRFIEELIQQRLSPARLRAFALRYFDTLRMAWAGIAKAADSMPEQGSLFKTAVSGLKDLAEGEES